MKLIRRAANVAVFYLILTPLMRLSLLLMRRLVVRRATDVQLLGLLDEVHASPMSAQHKQRVLDMVADEYARRAERAIRKDY